MKIIFFRKIVDIEETQVLESTEIIEETPTEVSIKSQLSNPKEDKEHIHYSSFPINMKNIKLLYKHFLAELLKRNLCIYCSYNS